MQVTKMARTKKPKIVPMIEPIKEQPKKSVLDKPIKEVFSFNVDATIKDTADRSRRVVDNFNRSGISIIPKRNWRRMSVNKVTGLLLGALGIILGLSLLNVMPAGILMLLAACIVGFGFYYFAKKFKDF